MIRIDENGEVFINGKKVTETSSGSSSKTIKKSVVIKNGKVVQNDFSEDDENFDVEEFKKEFIDEFKDSFPQIEKSTKVKCAYCGSVYKSTKPECPNCGANNNSI